MSGKSSSIRERLARKAAESKKRKEGQVSSDPVGAQGGALGKLIKDPQKRQYADVALKFSLLALLVPLFFGLPYFVEYTTDFFADNSVWVYLFFTKKNHTYESWFTAFLTWALFAMGTFAMIGVFNFLDARQKQVVLKLWVTISFLPYLVYIWLDKVDHWKLAYIELKKEERAKKKAEAEAAEKKARRAAGKTD